MVMRWLAKISFGVWLLIVMNNVQVTAASDQESLGTQADCKNNSPPEWMVDSDVDKRASTILADVSSCKTQCMHEAQTCLRGCDNLSDPHLKASCYDGCRRGEEACHGRCQ